MKQRYLYETLDVLKDVGTLNELPHILETSLAPHIILREYQEEAFRYFITYFENENLSKNKQIHNLFHMATGSGKTVIMAGLIIYLYTKGYRNFMFFVNQTNILEKTKENFLNPLSSKYLFNDNLEIHGQKVNIRQVDNFSGINLGDDINISFTTTQKLHMDLVLPKENSLTFKDFEDNKIVFISDESHHVNTMTKLNKTEEEAKTSWEYSVLNAFYSNKDNILLEFTATVDLKGANVRNKYYDKIIYNYPLYNFRQSGYTKDFQNFATESSLWQRSLIAIIMSEYRKFLFADYKLNIKPVILMKSQRIKASEEFYIDFFKRIKNLTVSEIESLYLSEIEVLVRALDYFKEKDSSFELLINSIRGSFTKETSIIMNGTSDNSTENQLLVNSLEDENNPIRTVFAVDMLNEGWDVLNLFDIVRLYDTRQGGRAGRPGAYTIREAQLIGRGARYCPFQFNETQEKFKRKYDWDLDNKNRILETMYFHSKNDSKYISELRQALIATGLEDENPIKRTYRIKEAFKETELYNQGLVFSNKRIPKNRSDVFSINSSMQNKVYRYTQEVLVGSISNLFGDSTVSSHRIDSDLKTLKFKDIDYNILLGASEKYNQLQFSSLKKKYPNLKSMSEFLTSSDYLGNSTLEIKYYTDKVLGRDIYLGLINAFQQISNYISAIKPTYQGTKTFDPMSFKAIIKDKKVNFSKLDPNGGRGVSQIENPNSSLQLDLSKEDWYIFNDNYGTDQEKLFIKFFKTDIKPLLKEKNLEFYVVRNERVADLAIYTFENGERFEPDFLIFIRNNSEDSPETYQVYGEPKGEHLILTDKWKEDFLLKLHGNAIADNLHFKRKFKVIGLPFYNSNLQRYELVDHIKEIVRKF